MEWSQETKSAALPDMFRPLFWSYRFEDLDPEAHKSEIIVQTINYGTLNHWRWIIEHYGKAVIRGVLEHRLETEFTLESRRLAQVLFDVDHFSHAPRSAH